MKRFFIILTVLCIVGINSVCAQPMQKDGGLLNIGLGFLPGAGVNFSYDHGLIDQWGDGIFTVGGLIGFQSRRTFGEIDDHTFVFTPRATYRYAINNDFEVYASAMLGFQIYKVADKYNAADFSGITAGCRYTFSGNISVFAEVSPPFHYVHDNISIAIFNGGLSISF